MKINPRLKGHFENWQEGIGYTLTFLEHKTNWLGMQTPCFRYDAIKEHPLIWRQEDGGRLMPACSFPTDHGTVKPIIMQLWIPKDRFVGFYPHDGTYSTGGMWYAPPGSLIWQWVEINRVDTDTLLRMWCLGDPVPCGWWKSRAVWTGVRAGGWKAPFGWWGWRGDEPRGEDPNDWRAKPDVDD